MVQTNYIVVFVQVTGLPQSFLKLVGPNLLTGGPSPYESTAMNTHTAPARWSKSHPSWGSARRVQRNAYAYAVTMVMTDNRIECPACEGPLNIDTAEVDRVIPSLDYCEGNIVYLCRGCNQSRAVLQSAGNDWTMVDQYASDVASASARVTVPTVADAREWWANRDAGVTRTSRYA